VTVTELVGWEHSMKNELIIAELKNKPVKKMADKIEFILDEIGLAELKNRYIPKLLE
jgi:ABC-type nitrate/sulfonate/bicarbonate transport system ATPase subunit